MSTIFIVGAGPQLGLQVPLLFTSKGFTSVGLAARSKSSLESLASKFPQSVKVAIADGTDASDAISLVRGLNSLEKSLGKPDVVVYNASSLSLGPKPLSEMSVEDFEAHLRITTTAAFVTGQWVTKHANLNGEKQPTALFTGGKLARQPRPGRAGLATGKAGLVNLTKAFQLEFPDIHFAVVTIMGLVDHGDEHYTSKIVAKEYWKLYEQKKADWQVEGTY